nr:glycohydrolase toxin TNT-related protein [Escherichia coli]
MHQPPVRFTYRLLSYLISTIIAGQPLLPAVGAVITPQNGAGMDKAANGVPVVNIATPNGAGISHNRFTDYNVGKEGLILNNATGKLNPTQLGGLIQNNPNLKAGGEAKGIINEVTGGNRSLLQGYTEVAGKAANVMVANPYGITCDGCGFINTPHATLTTGRPVMNADGSLQALEVTEGSITINGAGLDGTRSDAVSIIARATEVNAALHAKDLTVTAGANRVTADGRVSALKGEGDVPKVAVDTGALGGMYARRIHLTSTESGVGVNLGNLYARDGDITLDASGRLTVNNSLATGAVTAKGQGVTLTGDHKAGGNLSVSSRSDIVLSNGTLNSDKNLSLTAGGRITQQNEKLTAGRDVTLAAKNITQDTASQINAARDIVTVASDTLTTQGQITAGQNLTASATTLTQDGILLAKGHAGLDAGTLNNSGAVQGASLTLGSTTLSNSGSLLSGGRLTVNTRDFTQSGRTGAKGKVDITASGNPGKITADTLNVRATTLDGDGLLQGAGALALAGDTLSQGSHGRWLTAGDLSLRGKTLNTAGTTQGQNLTVQADNWANSGSVLATGNLTASATGQLTSTGDIMSQGDTTLKAATTDNRGSLLSAGTLSLDGNSLDNSGTVQGDHVTIRQNSVTNSGTLTGIAALTLAARMVSPQKAQQKYDALLEKDISSDKAVIAACSNGQAASVACAGERLRVIAAKGGYETGNYNNQVSDMYPDAYGQIVNLLNITSVDAQNQQQVKDAMVNYAMTQFGVDKATAESYVETYDGMKTVAASMTPVLGAAAANKISVLGQGIVKESVSKNPNSSSAITDAEAGGYSYYDKFKNANGGWDWPKNLGFEGDPIKTIIPVGTRLDRYGEPTGSFLAPKGTPYEQRALAPGTKAEKYYEYEVIKPLPAIQGKIAPAFGEPGGGIQILPNMQERVNVEWLLKNGYIREVR